jgi:uncharacterized protein (DUF433 family)
VIATPEPIDVPLRVDQDGVIRVGDTRVTLITLVGCYQRGDTPEEIHEGFPTIPLADIYAVIAYYLNHREEVDAYIEQEEAEAEKWRQEYEANNPQVAASNAKFRALLNEKRKNESG